MKSICRWIDGRLGYIFLILILLVVVPAALIAVTEDIGIGKPTLEFLLGTWPAQKYNDDTIVSFKAGGWLYLGITLRYLAVFLIPVILSVLIIWLVRKIRGLETMLLRDYLGYRDTFVRNRIFATFVDVVNKAGLNDKNFDSQLEEAYRQADKAWHDVESERYANRIQTIEL